MTKPTQIYRGISMASSRWLLVLMAVTLVTGYALARQQNSADAEKEAKKSVGKDPVKAKKPADKKIPENPFPRRFKAPSLDGGAAWLNTSGPISMKDLRGKIVLLDFWTYCCINCLHVLPDLKYLEKKFPNQIVVIGVHSAKFDNEKISGNIRKAILKHEIEHPVINDSKMTVWNKFNVRAWPTLVVVDPEGNYCGYVSGEGNRPLLELVIKKLIKYHKAKRTLDESPIRFDLESSKLKPTPLRFPGKLLADERSNRLFIADTSHNRIIISTLDGKLIDIVGSGAIGADDGDYAKSTFDHPQGMTLVKETLYVADVENHLIRKIDLKKETVSTLAGTGKQARVRPVGGKLRDVPLNSPWALTHVKGTLYICMAGPHQIWSHKLGSESIERFSGTGREDVTNGGHAVCAYAQPSGISSDGKFLYVTDSEGSAIRRVAIDPKGEADTLVGTSDLPLGRSLFEFGDRDGLGSRARLQHPLGLVYHDNKLYVADSYNHKIRVVEILKKTGKLTTWLGNGKPGTNLKPPRFSEPSGVTVAPKRGKLYIADTNNNRLCVADLKTGAVSLLEVAGLKPPKKAAAQTVADTASGAVTVLKSQAVKSGATLTLTFPVDLPKDYKLNSNFPHRYRLATEQNQTLFAAIHLRGKPTVSADGKSLSVEIPLEKSAGEATFRLSLTFGYCRAGKGGLCKLKTARWTLPLKAAAAEAKTTLTLPVNANVQPKTSEVKPKISP